MSQHDDVREKVKDMAKLSMLTDRISEVQEKNLKLWAFVFFEGVTAAEIQYDLSNNIDIAIEENQEKGEIDYKISPPKTKHLRVSYHLTLDERVNSKQELRFKAVENAVRTIFWGQIKVEVFFNDKKVYESKDV